MPVESSNLAGVAYVLGPVLQPDNGLLVVQFKSGSVYTYRGVPPSVHPALLTAKSKGKYLQAHVVGKGAYPFERVTDFQLSVNRLTQEKKV